MADAKLRDESQPLLRHYLRALRHDPVVFAAAVTLVIIIASAIFAPWLTAFGVNEQSIANRLERPLSESADGRIHLFGSDQLGRDLLTRIMYGGRISITVGTLSVLISGITGSMLGIVAGYRRGRTDDFIMRVVDLQMGFPPLLLAIFVLYAIGPGLINIVAILAVVRWPIYARVARGLTLSISEMTYVEGARALGNPSRSIVLWHILPNVASPLMVLATLEFSRTVLAEASLSFLGLGIQPPTASWGRMVAEARQYIGFAWWLVLAPGLAILATALSTNLLAVWLRGVTDPGQRWRILQKTEGRPVVTDE